MALTSLKRATLVGLLCVSLTLSCDQKSENQYHFEQISGTAEEDYSPGYEAYCALNQQDGSYEIKAVRASFYGDYRNALVQATLNASVPGMPQFITAAAKTDPAIEKALAEARDVLENEQTDEGARMAARQLIMFLSGPATAEEKLTDARPVKAVDYIVEQAADYHFTLINEAHYSSQHRAFTQTLLRPLWVAGYRYLALETFTHSDTLLQQRGYPVEDSGFYTRDPHLANVVREALRLGYTMIPYETRRVVDGTERDDDQARNIYQQTFARDTVGKVLVHAGYSHINENGDQNYQPMGFQLKKMSGVDILTVDQVKMVSLEAAEKEHAYYRLASERFELSEPLVFLDQDGEPVIDPINQWGIDIQVYHPSTQFVHGRPHWTKNESNFYIELPETLRAHRGQLLQAIPTGERDEAVPVDRFVIGQDQQLILPEGTYRIQLIDCEGTLTGQYRLAVPED